MKSKIIEALEFNINGATATATNVDQVFADHVPAGLTIETINQSNEYQREFQAALTEAALPKMVDGMKSDAKLGLMALEANLCGRTYGVVLTRPDVESPTAQQYTDGVAVYVSDRLSDSLTAAVNNAGTMWAN